MRKEEEESRARNISGAFPGGARGSRLVIG